MNSIIYKPGLVKKIARLFLNIVKRYLPKHIYIKTYDLFRLINQRFNYFFYFIISFFLSFFVNKDTKKKLFLTRQLLPYTMGGWKAMHNAFDSVKNINLNLVDGDLVECGVARGGISAMMLMANNYYHKIDREIWLFDSFEGLPSPSKEDFQDGSIGESITPLDAGDCVGKIDEVKELFFKKCNLDTNKVNFVKGWFQETIPANKDKLNSISILRLDGDWYESTKIPLENLYNKVSKGGVIIIDDYATCFGSKKAVDEFLSSNDIKLDLKSDQRGGAWFLKP